MISFLIKIRQRGWMIRRKIRSRFEEGYVYSEYAMIPFDMEQVKAQTSRECKVIEDYEELREWWENEE